jgi:hypothetical protein
MVEMAPSVVSGSRRQYATATVVTPSTNPIAYDTARRVATPPSQSAPATAHKPTYTAPSQTRRSSVAGWSHTINALSTMTMGGMNAAHATVLVTRASSRLAQ